MNQFLAFRPSDTETPFVQSKKIYVDKLPIRFHKSEILYAVDKYSCVVVVAETGSGKTTQIPQYLVEVGFSPQPQRVLVSLPRRMAAISIAQRVSDEYGTQLGDQVGYRVRFDSRVSNNTKIEYVTDGTLVQLMMADPLLQLYTVIMIDDVHERTINTDLVLALLKKIRRKRPELKLVISSATVQAEEIASYFEDEYKQHKFQSQILEIQGRTFPVDIFYLNDACKNYVVAAAEIAAKLHREKKGEGDILTFLTSAEEVHVFLGILTDMFAEKSQKNKMLLLPLYANLSLDKQLEVFKQTPPGSRKIIAATNIAESSITIDGIVYVIDCCHQKVKVFEHKKNFESMKIVTVSKQQADQRAGRAGRTRPGQCYRMCTKENHKTMEKAFPPEILRSRLNDLILQLRSFSLQPTQFADPKTFLSPIPEDKLAPPITTLVAQKLLSLEGNLLILTELGEKVVDYPLSSEMAICVERSFTEDFQCSEEMIKIAAVLSVQGGIFQGEAQPLTILKAKKAYGCKEGDQLSLCNILTRYQTIGNKGGWIEQHKISKQRLEQADKVYKQLVRRKGDRKLTSSVDDVEGVLRCLMTGYFMQVAQREPGGQEGVYRNLFNREIMHLHSTSILTITYPEWIIYNEVVEQSERLVMRDATEIDANWLVELAPHFFQDVRKIQATQKHKQELDVLDEFEESKKIQEQEKMITEEKVIFGRSKRKMPLAKVLSESGGFLKPNIPIKSKEDRIGSLKKSTILSFDDDDL